MRLFDYVDQNVPMLARMFANVSVATARSATVKRPSVEYDDLDADA
jgi:hypothetical protein